jgi:hypothetical protein
VVTSAELVEDLVELREAAGFLLREEHRPVAYHVVLAALSLCDVRRRQPGALDLGGETRRPLVVAASDRAVVDSDVHDAIVHAPAATTAA